MFGHKWEPVQGTIVESAIEQRAVEGQHGLHEVRVYTVDIRQSGGRHQRVSLPAPPNLHGELLPPGTAVRLQVHGKSGEVRFDPDNIAIRVNTGSAREAVQLARDLRGQLADGVSISAVMQQYAAATGSPGTEHAATPRAHTFRPDQAQELMDAIKAGGADRQDAIARIRQLRDEWAAVAQVTQAAVGGLAVTPPETPPAEGFSPPADPAGFDRVTTTPPAPEAPPVPPVAPVTPVTPAPAAATFGTPGTFDPITPINTFAEPASPANPFDVGGQFGPQPFGQEPAPGSTFGGFGESKSDRIAALQDQRDRGQLTEQQYETLRQQIQDEF